MIFLGDSLRTAYKTGGYEYQYGYAYLDDNNSAGSTMSLPHFRHSDRLNICYGDGHAAAIGRQDLKDSMRAVTGWTYFVGFAKTVGYHP